MNRINPHCNTKGPGCPLRSLENFLENYEAAHSKSQAIREIEWIITTHPDIMPKLLSFMLGTLATRQDNFRKEMGTLSEATDALLENGILSLLEQLGVKNVQ